MSSVNVDTRTQTNIKRHANRIEKESVREIETQIDIELDMGTNREIKKDNRELERRGERSRIQTVKVSQRLFC